MVGAEMPMSSDQVIWTEQNRLHIAYHGCTAKQGGNTKIRVPLEAGKECKIYLKKTNEKTLKIIPLEILKKHAIDLS